MGAMRLLHAHPGTDPRPPGPRPSGGSGGVEGQDSQIPSMRTECATSQSGQVTAFAQVNDLRMTTIIASASELARRLFERKGFAVVERQDLVIRGVAIHNYRIAKAL